MTSADVPTFKPRLRVINREQALTIHEAALKILGEIGIRMEHPGAFEMLVAAGANNTRDNWLTMPAEMVDGELQGPVSAAGVYALLAPVPPETTVTEMSTPATTAQPTTAPTRAGMEMLTVVAGAAVSLGLAAGRKG